MDRIGPTPFAPLSHDQFEAFVADYLRLVEKWSAVTRGEILGGLRVDIVGEDAKGRLVVAEVKHAAVIDSGAVERELGRRALLRRQDQLDTYVLVVSGGLTGKARELAQANHLRTVDGATLLAHDNPVIAQRWGPLLQASAASLESAAVALSPALVGPSLLAAGPSIPTGKKDFFLYQEWIRDVFEYLFVPPLGPIYYESSDAAARNRRDLILHNWADSGFWAQVRDQYSGSQVVVDAKNFSGLIGKQQVLELAHYLKPYGTGLFGLLVSRRGAGPAAQHAIREEWIGGSRMILALSDDDVSEMLGMKIRGEAPEELLRLKIGDFRRSL